MSKAISSIVIAGACLLLGVAPAFAMSVGAFSGRSATNATCWNESSGGVVNNCGSQQLYEVPLPVNNAGPKSINVSVTNSGAGLFQCAVYAGGEFGALTTGTSHTSPSGNDFFGLSITVPSGGGWVGGMYLYCQVPNGGAIWNITYTQ
jgi:hypothetical protein